MKGAFQIINISGIPIKLHWSFVLVLVWVVFEGRRSGMDWEHVLWFAFLMIGVFVCIVLHELGHAFSARRYGVETRDIILSPLGGVARLEGLPKQPIHESVVAAAGPLVNLLIAGVIGGYGWLTSSIDLSNLGSSRLTLGNPENFMSLFILINIFLALFNLIPAFPMDGGRIFRSLLSLKMGRLRATLVTTFLGQGVAVLLVGLAYYFIPTKMSWYLIPIFLFTGVFMFYMASQEYQMVRFEEILKRHSLLELVREPLNIFKKNDNIALAADAIKLGLEKDFIVKNEEGNIEGVLSEETILNLLKDKKNSASLDALSIEKYISPIKEFATANDTLYDFYNKMIKQQLRVLPVFENEKMLGVVDVHQLNEFLKLRDELD